ncbi:HNH endonuclease [Pseudofrankia inefficax]|uniref:HNH endonuclease n=2 Tax=Frankiaceae TaxID=74712 RepID=E3IYP3_PSEI1|nr:HNH endonuclease [Pseudofrankia inefficax]ADP85114.1 HNH endonuclease [Pseudofrankia inefficax]ADX97304.1 FseI [Frankia sp. Eul1b]
MTDELFPIPEPLVRPVIALPPHLKELIDLLPLNTPVHRRDLEAKYGRSNYARRIRKIISEYGWEIESRRQSEGANDDWYIRRSDGPVRPQRIRREVPRRSRETVYRRDDWICQICRMKTDPERGSLVPQCDHKIPADRGGDSDEENLQTLCTRCNLKKRQACGGCALASCADCPFAYPEKFDDVLILHLDREHLKRIMTTAYARNVTASAVVSDLSDLL